MIYVKEKIYQWETEVEIATDYPSLLAFACAAYGEVLEVETQEQNGKYVGNIPNILLQKPNNITVYAVDGSEKVRDVKLISVIYRAKPSDYVYTETEIKDYDTLAAQIEDIQEQIESIDVELPIASTDTLGGIKVGANLTIAADGKLDAPYSAKGDKGDKGDSGEAGQDGYTPQRGVDYWTSADIAEIHEYINENMPDGGSGSYTLPIASSSTLGGIKVGANLSITEDGTLSAASSGGGSEEVLYERVADKTEYFSSIITFNNLSLKKVVLFSNYYGTPKPAYMKGTLSLKCGDETTMIDFTAAVQSAIVLEPNNGLPYILSIKPGTGSASNGYRGDAEYTMAGIINANGYVPASALVTGISFKYYDDTDTAVTPSSCNITVWGVPNE